MKGVYGQRRLGPIGVRPRICQWIDGEPTGDDSCKCGRPVQPGRPYCPEHQARSRTMVKRQNLLRLAKLK